MAEHPSVRLHDLAKINRIVGKHALADVLDETAALVQEAEKLIRSFPYVVLQKPGDRCVVLPTDSARYAHQLGQWTALRDKFLQQRFPK